MKKIILLAFVIIPCILMAQMNLKAITRQGHYTFAFSITAADAEKFIHDDSITLDRFANDKAKFVFPADSVNTDLMPLGYYVLVSVNEGDLITEIVQKSNLIVYPVNNQFNIQLNIRNKNGEHIKNAEVWINNKKAKYDLDANTYLADQREIKEGFVRVYAPRDTCLVRLERDDNPMWSPFKQRWRRFKGTKAGRIVTWIPDKTKDLFIRRYYGGHASRDKGTNGYVLFSQPKYKLTDTVRLKAYIVNRKWKRYSKDLDLFLEYYSKGQQYSQQLGKVHATSPGSYIYSFPLSDTLESDKWYSIEFKNKKGSNIISKGFSTEDYLLDEINSYKLRTDKEEYNKNDSLFFYASAKDANDLPLLDGKVRLILIAQSINRFYKDTVQVSDTLYSQQKSLETDGETVFRLHSGILPAADLTINAKLIFINSNNEIQEKASVIDYRYKTSGITLTRIADTLLAEYRIDGRSTEADGSLYLTGDLIERKIPVLLPAKIRIDPLADNYSFSMYHLKDTITKSIDIDDHYSLELLRISNGDTLGFSFANPYKIPVNFIVLDGNKIIYNGWSDNELISWKRLLSKRKIYLVKWQYTWGGKRKQGSENIALLYKILQVNVNNSEKIFPGQKDTVTIEVKDYKNRPAEGVNLSAVAYNTQFKKDINVNGPPYLVKYRRRLTIVRRKGETDEISLHKKYPLGEHRKWIGLMSLDTMLYYNVLFPATYPYDIVTPITEFAPQLSVHVVKNGIPQDIYLLYINRNLAYYAGVTTKMPYAFETMQNFSQVGVRLYDRYIEIDSIYIQPYYKHDIIIDLDSLPAKSKMITMPLNWTSDEKRLIENSIWQFNNGIGSGDSYIWQNSSITKVVRNGRQQLGPFKPMDSLHFYSPGNFDIHFLFEPGYEYELSKQIARLEKQSIFRVEQKKNNLPKPTHPALHLGDTIIASPAIIYAKPVQQPYLQLTPLDKYKLRVFEKGKANLQLEVANDTVLRYVVLYSPDTSLTTHILGGNTRNITNIQPGKYDLLLVNRKFTSAEILQVECKPGYTLCVQTKQIPFKEKNRLLDKLLRDAMFPTEKEESEDKKEVKPNAAAQLVTYPSGNGFIRGKVIDTKGGNGIPGAMVFIEGAAPTLTTLTDGSFVIGNIKEGAYTIVIKSIGYRSERLLVNVLERQELVLNIPMDMESSHLDEVVVTGYSAASRRSLTGAVVVINANSLTQQPLNALRGKAAGINMSGQGAPGASPRIQLRGINSLSVESVPLYVIDGIFYEKMPSNVTPEMIVNIEVLKDAEATSIYGSRAANGVVVITTGSKKMRKSFRDYGFWQPELFTGADGKVSFEATYPDNVTGWEIYVLGMDKNRRMGKGVGFAKAYKPIMAQLNTPQFLVKGDSALVVAKSMNYTTDNYSVQTEFKINGRIVNKKDSILPAKASVISYLPVKANENVLNTSFVLKANTGFTDGEERKIPVLNIGTEETKGQFFILPKDTIFSFSSVANAGPVEIFAQNNTLDILLNELDHLKKYPYYCMEQTASKLKGLVMERKIKDLMKQPFKDEKDIRRLVKKLQDGQLFDGGWAWWSKAKANIPVTTYILEALLLLRNDPLIETSIRNGLLFLQNQLPYAEKEQALQILSCLSSAGHAIDYKPYFSKISFDSLSQHQQWQWVRICQQQKLEHHKQLEELVKQQTGTMTGGVYWGTETYRWYNNTIATTLLAYLVLEQDNKYNYLLEKIMQYFIGERRESYWTNTVESASITAAILPRILNTNVSFNEPAIINIDGDSSFIIRSYPYSVTLSPSAAGKLIVRKSGGGISYVTLYQKWWNSDPSPVTGTFNIQSYFEKDGRRLETIISGEKIKMKVKLNVLKDADYVMTEIPIPAGCNYSIKNQDGGPHKEFMKNKVVIFSEYLKKGEHLFEIELEPRYRGRFTINPAKAELMYFPAFYGRNQLNNIDIR